MKRVEHQAEDGTIITELIPTNEDDEREIERLESEGEVEGDDFDEWLHPEVDLDEDDDG